MIEFIIKSTISLIVTYGFYYLFLRNVKSFGFNRFYLLFSLFFAFLNPFINFRFNIEIPVGADIPIISNSPVGMVSGNEIGKTPGHVFKTQDVLLGIYLLVSSILFLRFVFNLFKIFWTIYISTKEKYANNQIVLTDKKTLPYTFLNYIFINRDDYHNGKIENELIVHEQAHSAQYHTIDILIIELIWIVFWFNPIVWLFKKAIQTNHEYLADNKVLSKYELNDYLQKLLKVVFRNNSTYLASDFNYSLSKKRLIMMTKNNASKNAIFRKIAIIPLFLVLTISLTFSQEIVKVENTVDNEKYTNEWWYPILKKHNIELKEFSVYDNIFAMGTKKTIENNVAMGSKKTTENNVVTFENAFILAKPYNGMYYIIHSSYAKYFTEKDVVEVPIGGSVDGFNVSSNDLKPIEQEILTFKKWYQFKKDN